EKNVSTLNARRYELLIAETSNIPTAMVAAEAEVPLRPAYPRVTISLIGVGLLAVCAALAAIYVTERVDTTIHDPALATRMAGVTLLTDVPEMPGTEDGSRNLIGNEKFNHAALESFRLLRNNINFSSPDVAL